MKPFLLLLLIAVLGSLPALTVQGQPVARPAYQLNERIEVNTLGSWDKATIIEVGAADRAGEFKVHYDGWASSFDRWLQPVYFRKTTAPATPPGAQTPQALSAQYQLDERIEVNTLGSWDKATIIAVGTGEHEHEFKVHYEGYASSYDRWLLPVYFRKTTATATNAGAATPPPTNEARARQEVITAAPAPTNAAAPNADEPRLGKYNITSYGAVGNPPLYLGHLELLTGGKYRISRKRDGDYYGDGNYAFDAATSTIQWLSGPCKDNAWSGAFTAEREGKTHKLRLRSGTIATNSAD